VRSVYDTDQMNRMAENVLAPVDLPAGCARGIAQTAPSDPNDTRNSIADLAKIKNPADPAYHCAPARFVRATRAVAPMAGMTGMREAIGETDFEPQQILGYAPVEPDGSFKLLVPADTPIALSIIDAKGRALQTHLNWIQVRPGERRTCDGCHSPRRGASINAPAITDTLPAALRAALTSQHASGETMASTRTKVDPTALNLLSDMLFTDLWADTTQAGITARQAIALRYTGNANAADDLATPAPVNGTINYPDHIQPIWSRDRGANTCTGCHADATKLDLRATLSGTGRLTSYQELLLGDPVLDGNGQPVTRIVDGVREVVRGPALVETMAGGAEGLTRSSRLGEILFGETLKASAQARTAHPNPPGTAPNHATLLNAAEKRLVTEWMDLGGQYFNNVNASNSPVRRATALSEAVFTSSVQPVLTSQCLGCHQPGQGFARNRFILTGSAEGDYNVTLSMVSNTCQPAANALLLQPSTSPHPSGGTAAVLPAGSAGYQAIANWIQTGCP
jgi:Hydrazine synthase alpha subunit middle domain